jgi:adenylate cyclase
VISLHVAMVGQWDHAMKLMGKAMSLNPHHPGWFHIVAFINYYRHGDYDLALIEAQRFNTPDFFWDPLIRAAVLGQLDRRAEAEKAVDELLALVPDFNLRGRSLIRRLAYLDEHVDMLAEGLRKAGLKTQDGV